MKRRAYLETEDGNFYSVADMPNRADCADISQSASRVVSMQLKDALGGLVGIWGIETLMAACEAIINEDLVPDSTQTKSYDQHQEELSDAEMSAA